MSSASMPPQGFATARGRGYRPEQVDARLAALWRERDAAWDRAARLTVLARDMEAKAARLRETVAGLAPQDYETLGASARRLFRLALEEERDIRERARRAAYECVARAEADGEKALRAARKAADALRAEADEHARRRLLAARAEADALRVGTRREVRKGRGEALEAVREVRRRTAGLLDGQSREHTGHWAGAEREEHERTADLETRYAERTSRAEADLAEAGRALAEAEASARRVDEEAHARAAAIVADARAREEGITRRTEQMLREHGEAWDAVRAHMDEARSDLTSLTGPAAAE
ncbi:cellulose-binding protein [Streptomyces sp. NPDC059688]|uniref:cellulose-binding protein n=1 Tax=Streptomyces sp. NPDC059688 TaxID=3346906 RepID=UPI0036A3F74C